MRTVLRIVGGLVALLLLIIAVLAAYLAFVFDPNDYRERIAREVEERTGRNFAIEGDLALSVFPWIGIELEGAHFGNAEGFGPEPFASMGEIEVRARLIPLLRSELEVDRIVLRDVSLALERDASGRTNWADLVAAGDEETPTGEAAAAPEADDPSADATARAVAAFAISGIDVENARVTWHDRESDTRYEVSRLRLRSGEIRPGTRFPLELNFDFATSEPALEGQVVVRGDVLLDEGGERLSIEGLRLDVDAAGETLPGGEAELRLAANPVFDLGAGTFDAGPVEIGAYGVKIEGNVEGEGLNGDAPQFAGALQIPTFNPREMLRELDIEVPETADDSALSEASLAAQFTATTNSIVLEPVQIRLDQSTLEGRLAVADFARQALRFDLALDAIDADRYLPPQQDTAAATPGAAAVAIDPAMLRDLDLEGRLRIGELTLSGLTVRDIELNARGANGVLDLSPLSARLYDGEYAGNVRLDGSGSQLAVRLDERLEGIQIGPLLRDLTDADERLTGRASLAAQLNARGNEVDDLMATLSGDADFRFEDGAIQGVNIAAYLREAQARLRGEPAPEVREPNQTDFSALTGTLQIAEGVVNNRDLDIRSPLLRVAGEGSANLVNESIDYLLRASVVATLEGQGGAGLSDLRGVTVPIRVSGTFDNPRYALDIESLLRDNVRERAREEVEERLREHVPEDVEERLRRGLGGLLGR